MSRRTVALIAAAIGLGYLTTLVLAVALWDQHRTLDSMRADLAATRAQIQFQAVKGTNPSASPTAVAALPSTTAAPSASATPVFPSLSSLADSLGNTWRQMVIATADLKEGTVITFTASAHDPLNRPVQYKFWVAPTALQTHLLCDWGSSTSCTWTATRLVNCAACQTLVYVAIRIAGSTNWRDSGCFGDEPCDDWLKAQYVFTS
jgi:hypothetical protein